MSRRIKVVPQSPSKDSKTTLLKTLQFDYKAFKKANPERYARVPQDIKLMAKSAIDLGSTVSELAKILDLSPSAVMSWLKTFGKVKKTRSSRKSVIEAIDKGLPAASAPAPTSHAESPVASKSEIAIALALPLSAAKGDTDHNWVRIRISGHVMEVDWNDFVGKLPLVQPNGKASKAENGAVQPSSTPGDGEDFNRALHEDFDLSVNLEKYEKMIIANAVARHASITACCNALNIPRSTLDARRRKYQLN